MGSRKVIILFFLVRIFIFPSSAQMRNEITRASNQSMQLDRKFIKKITFDIRKV